VHPLPRPPLLHRLLPRQRLQHLLLRPLQRPLLRPLQRLLLRQRLRQLLPLRRHRQFRQRLLLRRRLRLSHLRPPPRLQHRPLPHPRPLVRFRRHHLQGDNAG
jgi:hypothetical protein